MSLEKANFELKAKSDRLENQFLLVTQQNLNDFRSTLEGLDAKFSAEISELKSAMQVQTIEINTLKLSESDLKTQLTAANFKIAEIEKNSAELAGQLKILSDRNTDDSPRLSTISGNATTVLAVSGRPGARGFPGPMGPPGRFLFLIKFLI